MSPSTAKPTKWPAPQPRLRSACTSEQSNQQSSWRNFDSLTRKHGDWSSVYSRIQNTRKAEDRTSISLIAMCWVLTTKQESFLQADQSLLGACIIWAEARQNQLNDLSAQRRLSSVWASAQPEQSSQCAQWVANDPKLLHTDSEDSDQTGQIPKLIWIFAGHSGHFVGFDLVWLVL